MAPEFFADVEMYSADEGGKIHEAWPGWGCPVKLAVDADEAFSVFPRLQAGKLRSGDKLRLGFVTTHDEARLLLSQARMFYFWEGRIVGQARLAQDDPAPLWDVFDLLASKDKHIADEAGLALKMYIERSCVTGSINWWNEIGPFLDLPDVLAAKVSVSSLRDLHVHRSDIAKLCFRALEMLPKGGENAWRYAHILKRATAIEGLEEAASDYIAQNWAQDEVATLHLLSMIWTDIQLASSFKEIMKSARYQPLANEARARLEFLEQKG